VIVKDLFQHLRGRLHEVTLDIKAASARPLILATEDVVHQMAELMQEDRYLGVLHQAGVARSAAGKVAHQRALGKLPPGDSRHQRRAREPLILARARVHVEIDPRAIRADLNLLAELTKTR
jgi:hypothetical protein